MEHIYKIIPQKLKQDISHYIHTRIFYTLGSTNVFYLLKLLIGADKVYLIPKKYEREYTMAILAVRNLTKSYVDNLLFDGVSFETDVGDKAGLIGVNGSGKTTLFRIITGNEEQDSGYIYKSRETRIGYMAQQQLYSNLTLYEAVLEACEMLISMEAELDCINDLLSTEPKNITALLNRYHRLQEQYEAAGGLTYKSRTRSTLLGLGFTESELFQPLSTMSGGQRSKAMLAKVLISEANLLLLDEPTNHLDIKSIEWLEEFLNNYNGAFIVISHDRYFLDKVTNRTLELHDKRITAAKGNYSRYMELKSSAAETALRQYNNTRREIRRIQGIVEQQRRWGQEHNFITAASKLKQIERLQSTLVKPEKAPDSVQFEFKTLRNGGNDVLIAEDLSKHFDGKMLFNNIGMHIRRSECVFLLGPNGCGKTTLLNIITGKETADSGEIKIGTGIDLGYYEQHMKAADINNTAIQEIWNEYPKLNHTQIRNALAAFLFRGDDVLKQVSLLSGGELARIQLLKLMLSGANFLLLDEPTNHLDIASREALESALDDYEGTMLIVTHDRYLVNRLADRILYMESGRLEQYIGGYDYFIEAKSNRDDYKQTETCDKQEKVNEYKLNKERQSAINRAAGEVRRAEARISDCEAELEAIEGLLALPEVATDYIKAGDLAQQAEEIKIKLDEFYTQWEQAQAEFEHLAEN